MSGGGAHGVSSSWFTEIFSGISLDGCGDLPDASGMEERDLVLWCVLRDEMHVDQNIVAQCNDPSLFGMCVPTTVCLP